MELHFNRDGIKKVKKSMLDLVRYTVSNPDIFSQMVAAIESKDTLEVCASIFNNLFELVIINREGSTIYTYDKNLHCLQNIQFVSMKQFSHLWSYITPHLEENDTEYSNLGCRSSENFTVIVG